MSEEKCNGCGARCGYAYINFDYSRPNPLCSGEVTLYDEVEIGGEIGWEMLHFCEYHGDIYYGISSKEPNFPEEVES